MTKALDRVVLTLAGLLWPAVASAQLQIDYLRRHVCDVTGTSPLACINTFELGPLNLRSPGYPDTPYALQDSDVTNCSVSLNTLCTPTSSFPSGGADNVFDLYFYVKQQADFTLSVTSLVTSGLPGGEENYYWFALSGDGLGISGAGNIGRTWFGTLQPGVRYHLVSRSRSQNGGPSLTRRSSGIIEFDIRPTTNCPADLDADGVVALADLAIVITNWGKSVPCIGTDGDANGDGEVDLGDVGAVVLAWNQVCDGQGE